MNWKQAVLIVTSVLLGILIEEFSVAMFFMGLAIGAYLATYLN